MTNDILIYFETENNRIKKSSIDLLKSAALLSKEYSCNVYGCIVGIAENAQEIRDSLLERIFCYEIEDTRLLRPEDFSKCIIECIDTVKAGTILMTNSVNNKDIAAILSHKLNAGVITDCIDLRKCGSSSTFIKPLYGGKALSEVSIISAHKIILVRPNAFKNTPLEAVNTELVSRTFNIGEALHEVRSFVSENGKLDVSEADIIVAGGRGLKEAANFVLLEELASILGGAVGASRAVVDAGWRPHDEQIGQTGKTVSPKIYIAIGISGAIQHMAGMASSDYIIAINKDKDAPIFNIANYGIVGDFMDVVPALISEIRDTQNK